MSLKREKKARKKWCYPCNPFAQLDSSNKACSACAGTSGRFIVNFSLTRSIYILALAFSKHALGNSGLKGIKIGLYEVRVPERVRQQRGLREQGIISGGFMKRDYVRLRAQFRGLFM